MASLLRVPRSSDAGAGGKIRRGRRSPPSASPYCRSEGESRNATWISVIVASAGRLISSVFRSTSPSCSYSYSTDDDSNEDEDMGVSSREPNESKQMEKKLEPVKNCSGMSLAIISEIESKLAIEQLLTQETFSRDEGYELIKIIESRVLDVGKDEIHKELFDQTTCNAVATPGTWKPPTLSRKLPEAISYSPSTLNATSPGISAFKMRTPELHSSAVMQAKKWLEDKKTSSTSKVDFDSRSFTLNTDMLQYDYGVEEGSPVEVAKSYMRSMSTWKSPSLSSMRLEKTPCTGLHFYKDEEAIAMLNHSVPSSKGLKRNHPAFGSQENVDEIRRVRLKSADVVSDNSKLKLIDTPKRYSRDEACKISSVNDELIHHNAKNLSENSILDTEGDVSAALSTPESSTLATLPAILNSSVGTDPQFHDPATTSDENQEAEEPGQAKEQLDSLPIPTPSSLEHAEGISETRLISEAQDVPPIEINNSILSDVEAATRPNDSNTASIDNSLNQKLFSTAEEIHYVPDSAQHTNGHIWDEANGLIISADGSSADLNTTTDGTLVEEPNPTNVTNGIPERTSDHPRAYKTKVALPKTTKSIRAGSRPRGGAKLKSIKDVPIEPRPATSRTRVKKAAPGAKRGRGK